MKSDVDRRANQFSVRVEGQKAGDRLAVGFLVRFLERRSIQDDPDYVCERDLSVKIGMAGDFRPLPQEVSLLVRIMREVGATQNPDRIRVRAPQNSAHLETELMAPRIAASAQNVGRILVKCSLEVAWILEQGDIDPITVLLQAI